MTDGICVEVRGRLVRGVTAVCRFSGPAGAWVRVFWADAAGVRHELHPERDVRIERTVTTSPRAAQVLAYWRQIVEAMPARRDGPNPLQRPYERLTGVHPDSVLGRYLSGEPIGDGEGLDVVPIFPFSSNVSQRAAVKNALQFPVSVIEGPRGTGKTQTILNLIASLIATPGVNVGVVSFNNAAVDNVLDKLVAKGFGHVVANLGNRDKREEFFRGQAARNATVEKMLAASEASDADPEQLTALAAKLDDVQHTELELAQLTRDADAHRLERRHFMRFLQNQDVPHLEGLPLLRRSSHKLLEFLADAELENRKTPTLRWVRTLRRLFKYGPQRGLDLNDTDLILNVQRVYYDRRIDELERAIADCETRLKKEDLPTLLEEHRRLSEQLLHAALRERYAGQQRAEYDSRSCRQQFSAFSRDYPVILSTCHSLRRGIGEGQLLDYVIIDEASQVDLLTAALALASCRRVVVVGDQRQLPHIVEESAIGSAVPPAAEYDYRAHSILTSLQQLYAASLPVTMLREHYRCDPAIIGFCNDKFYNGQLIPLTKSTPGPEPMTIVRTVEGSHMRQHLDGGRTNRREVDVIVNEVIPRHCADIPIDQIGITTPYRKQVGAVGEVLSSGSGLIGLETDTVHRYQGREKQAVIMSTVLDDTTGGRRGVRFADDPRLVNVAVSRATKRFILVTDHGMLPTSRNLRDLMGYIRYQDPDCEIVESSIVSVFDLLYQNYSARLRPLAAKLRGRLSEKSEDIVWTVLQDLLSHEAYSGLGAVPQVLLRSLVPDLSALPSPHAAFVQRRSSLDIVVYNRITRAPLLAIEVDGFAYHENNPTQLARDRLKDEVLNILALPLLRLPTTGSGEPERIRRALDAALAAGSPDTGQVGVPSDRQRVPLLASSLSVEAGHLSGSYEFLSVVRGLGIIGRRRSIRQEILSHGVGT
ncbi:MAG TPA: AAA domain-containing protein [Sinomonas sp.]|nr:AAA domain-containing protein [Sinomonas sp.]